MKPGISFIIQKPSPDLDTENYTGPKYYIRGAVHDVQNLLCEGFKVPTRVTKFIQQSFDDGNYRAEILDGDILYKIYRKPPRELVPKEEDNTPLERYQREQLEKFREDNGLAGDTPLGIKQYGAGSAPISDVDFEEGHEPTYDGLNQEIISGNVLGEPISIRCLDRCDTARECLSKKQCKKIIFDPMPRSKQAIEFERAIKEAAESKPNDDDLPL